MVSFFDRLRAVLRREFLFDRLRAVLRREFLFDRLRAVLRREFLFDRLRAVLRREFLLHATFLWRVSLTGSVLFYVGSFFYTPRLSCLFWWVVSLTHLMVF